MKRSFINNNNNNNNNNDDKQELNQFQPELTKLTVL